MSDCRFGVSPVNYPDPDPDLSSLGTQSFCWFCHEAAHIGFSGSYSAN